MTLQEITDFFNNTEFMIGNLSLSDLEIILQKISTIDRDATSAKYAHAYAAIRDINKGESRPLVVGSFLRQILLAGFTEAEVSEMVHDDIVGSINASDLVIATQKVAIDYDNGSGSGSASGSGSGSASGSASASSSASSSI